MKRIAIAGLGLIGARHARAVLAHADAVLSAVVEPNATLRDAWDVPGFQSLDDIDCGLDGVILATPSNMHAEHAEICLARGWPCLIEKPIEVSLSAADRIVAASLRAGLPVLTGHHRRYHASVLHLRALLAAGRIGRVVLASTIWAMKKPDDYFYGNWRTGAAGSPIMINVVHDIDLLRFLLGEVSEVTALGSRLVRGVSRVESGAVAMHFKSGAVASIVFADTSPSPWGFEAGTRENPNIAGTGEDFLYIMGTEGAVSFPSMTLWTGSANWSEAPQRYREPKPATDPLQAQLDHFLSVLDGATPLIDSADARSTLAVALEVERQLAILCPPAPLS